MRERLLNEEMDSNRERDSEVKPRLACNRALKQIGIQNSSPISFSPDGTRLAFVSGSHAIFLCVKHETENKYVMTEQVLRGHRFTINDLVFHPTDPILVSGGSEGIFIWDLETLTLKKRIDPTVEGAHESAVECLCWLYDGTCLASGSKDMTIKFWDLLEDWNCIETLVSHKAPVLTLAWSKRTNLLASAGRDSSIKIWDTRTLEPSFRPQRKDDQSITCQQTTVLDGHRGDVTILMWSADGITLYSGARDNIIKIWDVVSGKTMREITHHRGDIRSLHLLQRERILVSGSSDGSVATWEVAEHERPTQVDNEVAVSSFLAEQSTEILEEHAKDRIISSLVSHEEGVAGLTVNTRYPVMATASHGNCVRVWSIADLQRHEQAQEFVGHTEAITQVHLLASGNLILSASKDYHVNLYDIATLRRLARLDCSGSVYALAVHPQGTLALCGGTDYPIKAFCIDPAQPELFGKQVASWRGHCGAVHAIAVHPNGQLMVSGGNDFNLRVWRIGSPRSYLDWEHPKEERVRKTLDVHGGRITSLAFNSQGNLLASAATDHSINIYTVSGGGSIKVTRQLHRAHESVVSSIAWGREMSKDFLFSCSWDHTIKVWTSDGAERKTIRPMNSTHVQQISVSQDGAHLVAVTVDGNIFCFAAMAPFDCECQYLNNEGAIGCVYCGAQDFLTGSEEGMLHLWPFPSDEHRAMFAQPEELQGGPAFDELLGTLATRVTLGEGGVVTGPSDAALQYRPDDGEPQDLPPLDAQALIRPQAVPEAGAPATATATTTTTTMTMTTPPGAGLPPVASVPTPAAAAKQQQQQAPATPVNPAEIPEMVMMQGPNGIQTVPWGQLTVQQQHQYRTSQLQQMAQVQMELTAQYNQLQAASTSAPPPQQQDIFLRLESLRQQLAQLQAQSAQIQQHVQQLALAAAGPAPVPAQPTVATDAEAPNTPKKAE